MIGGGLAQLVERVICIDEARGSKPRTSNFLPLRFFPNVKSIWFGAQKTNIVWYHSVHFSVSRYYIFESWLTPCGTYDPIVRWSCNAESDARRPYAACDACQSTWSREKGADFSKCRSLFLLSTSPLPNKKASSQRPQHFLSKNILSTSHHASWAEKMTMRNAVWFHTAKATNQNANKSCGHSDLWDEEGFGGF